MSRKIFIVVFLICILLPVFAVAQSPGDTVGWTRYDYQTNGSTGTRCALDNHNGAHVIWRRDAMNAGGVIWNYVDSLGNRQFGDYGIPIRDDRCGMPQMSINNNGELGIVFNHADSTLWFVYPDIWSHPPNMSWPYNAITSSGYYQLAGVANWGGYPGEAMEIGYARSTNSGGNWSQISIVDTTMTIGAIITASRVSDKSAIIYPHPLYGDSSHWLNEVYYIESTDGVTWDWGNKFPVPRYEPDGDTLYAYADLDAVYDYNDNLHIIWNAVRVNDPFDHRTYLLHFMGGAETATEIAHHPDTAYWPVGCEWGAWNLALSKMSIAVNQANQLFVCYTRFNPDDCSASGYANGEIYTQYSNNYGLDWSSPINLTNSPSPNCAAGECNSDHWSSMAEETNDYLHIFYVNDKDAGGSPQTEGSETNNPMLYLRYPVAALGVGDGLMIPTSFVLYQNYPNPFNVQTKIDFELKKDAIVRLEIFNITGARVVTLIDEELSAGAHSVVWDANKMSSGIYYYSLKAGDEPQTRRMMLIK